MVLVCAADDGYAMPLAVMLASVLHNLEPGRPLALYVIDGGISAANKDKIQRVLGGYRTTLEWLEVDESSLQGMAISGHIGLPAYYRILIPDLLPAAVDKAIYLDCDLVVTGDLAVLWEMEMGEDLLLAVQDMGEPLVSSPRALSDYESLGLAADQEYFNSGVLVLALDRWRVGGVTESILRYLRDQKDRIRWWDQDGMNAVLAGKWGLLPPWWNQIPHIYQYESFEASPFPREVYDRVVRNPSVVHFATSLKPWHPECEHPYRDRFFDYLDQTPWAGWRPRWTARRRIRSWWRALSRAKRKLFG